MKHVALSILLFVSLSIPFAVIAQETDGNKQIKPVSVEEKSVPAMEFHESVITNILSADLVEIDGRKLTLLGVNAPRERWRGKPAECYSKESTNFLKDAVMGQKVRYSFHNDVGRHKNNEMEYIYLYVGDRLLNEDLIANGYAFADRMKEYSEKERFIALEAKTNLHHLGLWHHCPVECNNLNICRTRSW